MGEHRLGWGREAGVWGGGGGEAPSSRVPRPRPGVPSLLSRRALSSRPALTCPGLGHSQSPRQEQEEDWGPHGPDPQGLRSNWVFAGLVRTSEPGTGVPLTDFDGNLTPNGSANWDRITSIQAGGGDTGCEREK